MVDKLNKKELTTRRNNPNNRRQVEIHITEKGLELLKVIDAVLEEQTPPAHYSKITVKELKQLNLILDKIKSLLLKLHSSK